MQLPEDPIARKGVPLYSGLFQYFPDALAGVAINSVKGNAQHNIGDELFHDRSKSSDDLDACLRHIAEGDLDAACWRLLSASQKKKEAQGAPVAPAARNVPMPSPAMVVMQKRAEAGDDPRPGSLLGGTETGP